MTSGIYKLNGPNGYYYIGSSNQIERRITKHLQHLRENKHINKHLQNVHNKYEGFVWSYECLEQVPEQNLLLTEQLYLNSCFGNKLCLNLVKIANKPPSAKGRKVPEWVGQKISKAKKGWKPTEKTIQNMKLAAQARCANPDTIENMKIGFRARPGKRKPFYLIYNNAKQGPFYSTKECVKKTNCTISACSVYHLCKGRSSNIHGYSIKLVE